MTAHAKEVEQIFLAALNRSAKPERDAYVREACSENKELLCRVLELLDAHERSSGPLDGVPSSVEPTMERATSEQLGKQATECVGTQIGPYKLLQEMGHGGMGVVYMAEQKEPVKRRVALKIIKPGMDTQQIIARFEAERQALAMMDHPNIAKVLDAGATDSGRPYFVMELVNGLPVTQYCDQEHFTARERLQLFLPICQAVQHAHQKGIIHRDLKPSNVLVALYDSDPVPKVIDFGVAKATTQSLTEKTLFTQLGQIIGTLEYMSPEQAQRNQLDIDTRSDVYSLGVLLYELLTGSTPFDKQRLRSAAFEEILRIIREEEPPRPSIRLSSNETLPLLAAQRRTEPKKLSTLVRGELDWIVMKALEKDRGRRYHTAQGFADDVQRYLNQEAVQACPPSMSYQIRKFVRRHRGPVAVAVSFVLLLCAGIAGTTTGWTSALRQGREAMTARDDALKAQRQEAVQRYVSDISLARRLLNEGRVDGAEKLLQQHIPQTADEHDLRSFEWHYLRRLSQAKAFLFSSEQPYAIQSVAVSPDGTLIATASSQNASADTGSPSVSGELTLYSVDPANHISELRRIDTPASVVAFSPNGKSLVTGNFDGSLHLWSGVDFGEHTPLAAVHEDAVTAIAFSPIDSVFATGGMDRRIVLWNYLTAVEETRWEDSLPRIKTLAFSGNGVLAAGGGTTDLTLIDTQDSEPRRVQAGNAYINSLAFSPLDDNLLALGTQDALVMLLDISVAKESYINKSPDTSSLSSDAVDLVIGKHLQAVTSVAFLPDSQTLVSASQDETIKLWDCKSREEQHILKGHRSAVRQVVCASEGRLYSVSSDKTLKAWQVSASSASNRLLVHNSKYWVRHADYSKDGSLLATGGWDGTVQLWDTATNRRIHTYPAFAHHTNWVPLNVAGTAFHPQSDLIAVGSLAGEIKIWDARTHVTKKTFQAHLDTRMFCLDFSPDGSFLVSAAGYYRHYDTPGEVKVWNGETFQQEDRFLAHEVGISTLAFTPDSKILVTGATDGAVTLWQVDSGKFSKISDLPVRHKTEVLGSAVSNDGRLLATAENGAVHLWDLNSKTLVGRLPRIGGDGLVFSPDDRTLISSAPDNTIRLWNVETQREMLTLEGHTSFVLEITFSLDGTLASASGDGTVRLWPSARP